jgi:hypothetical protein
MMSLQVEEAVNVDIRSDCAWCEPGIGELDVTKGCRSSNACLAAAAVIAAVDTHDLSCPP